MPALSTFQFSRESWIHCKESSGEEVDECPGLPPELFHALLSPQQRSLQLWITYPIHVYIPNTAHIYFSYSSIQSLSHLWLFATPWIAARQASLSITNSQSLLRFTFIESVMPSSHFILCHPPLLLPPIPPSMSLFQWVTSSHEVAKVLEFQLQHQSFQRTPRTDQYALDRYKRLLLLSSALLSIALFTLLQIITNL